MPQAAREQSVQQKYTAAMKHGAYLRYLNNLLLINPSAVKEDLPVKLGASFLARERNYALKSQKMKILAKIIFTLCIEVFLYLG